LPRVVVYLEVAGKDFDHEVNLKKIITLQEKHQIREMDK
jgi:hypothetical protein